MPMADHVLCKCLDSPSIARFSLCTRLYSPTKPFFSVPFTFLDNPTVRKRRRKPLLVTLLSNPTSPIVISSQDFDIISTNEHSDGSVIFRFGDPSEVVKKDESEEIIENLSEVVERGEAGEPKLELQEGYSVVKVLDGDHEKEVLVKNMKREVKNDDTTEVVDIDSTSNGVIINEEISIVENKNGGGESSFEDSEGVELPVSVSSIEENGSSGSTSVVENVVHVEEGPLEKDEDVNLIQLERAVDSSFPMANADSSLAVPEETSYGSDEHEILGASADGLQGKSDTNLELDISGSFVEVLEQRSAYSDEPESLGASAEVLEEKDDRLIELESVDDVEVPQGKEGRESVAESGSLQPNSDTEESDEDSHQGSSQGNVVDVNLIDSGNKNETVMQHVISEQSDQSDVIEVIPAVPSTEAEHILHVEASHNTMEESDGAIKDGNQLMFENGLASTAIEGETRKDESENSELLEAINLEVSKLESTEVSVHSEEIPAELVLSSGAALLPHPSNTLFAPGFWVSNSRNNKFQVLTGGEDALFTHQNWFGVADGVGQWSLEGIDPGIYARDIIDNCESIVSDYNLSIGNPKEVLNLSVAKAESPGSATVLVAHFDGKALHVANIGDSGFIILRKGSIYQRSSPMHHEFNFPVQIESGDDPSQFVEGYTIDLDEGDIIIAGTDGLFDNLYEQEIASFISKAVEADKQPQEIAEFLATKAQEVGGSASSRSPFADAVQAAGYVGYSGGKLDNVAVVISLVQKQPQTL